MKTIGSHPGAISFRLSVMIILILILVVVFFRYLDSTQRELERVSIQQTKKIIDSALVVVFASYAVKGRLAEIGELEGGNPFIYMAEYQLVPPAYRGETDAQVGAELEPGWYYLKQSGRVLYKSHYLETDSYFSIRLKYDDLNHSGRFEADMDKFLGLQFVKTAEF